MARHLLNGDDNEAVTVIHGTVADLHDAVADAKRFNRTHALRHFIIAPEIAMGRDGFEQSVTLLAGEFGFDPQAALIVEHCKPRAIENVADRHWHIVVAEVDAATGKVLSSHHDRARHEKIGRVLELTFGHPITPGAHDTAVLAALRHEGRDDLADRLADHLGLGDRPVEAFTTAAHQAAKRQGVDLAKARATIQAAWAEGETGPGFLDRLAPHGLELVQGDKAGTWIVRTVPDGLFLGAGHRLVGVRKTDFNHRMEGTQDDNHNHPAEHRPGDPEGHRGLAAGYGNDLGPGEGDRPAHGGRGPLFHRRDDHVVADDREQGGRAGREPGSLAPAVRPARHRHGVAPDERRRLIATITTAVAAMVKLTRSGFHRSSQGRTSDHLADLEANARARVAAARSTPGPGPSQRLLAARMFHEGAGVRHDALWRQYLDVQERMAASRPAPSLWARLTGKHIATSDDALQRQHDALRAELIVTGRNVSSAMGGVARADKADAVERMAHAKSMEAELRAASEALGEILRTRQMARAFPMIMFTGPAFTTWAGQKVARRRRDGLRNPQARNIWGLPIEP